MALRPWINQSPTRTESISVRTNTMSGGTAREMTRAGVSERLLGKTNGAIATPESKWLKFTDPLITEGLRNLGALGN